MVELKRFALLMASFFSLKAKKGKRKGKRRGKLLGNTEIWIREIIKDFVEKKKRNLVGGTNCISASYIIAYSDNTAHTKWSLSPP